MTPVAHGVGTAAGLPLPLDLVLQAGAATVVLSFLISAFWWRHPKLAATTPRPFPDLRWARYLVLALTLYIVGNAIAGPRSGNPAAHALFVWLWVGLIPLSAILGPIWRPLNPLRAIFTLLGLPARGLRPLPPGRGLGAWPATAFLLGFVWFELIAPHHSDPVPVGLWILLYALTQLILATVRGEEWFARGDCFEVYSDLAGRLSPVHWRRPLSGLLAPLSAGSSGFLAVWWGSTVYDSAAASPWWRSFAAPQPLLLGTCGLVLLCALVWFAVGGTSGRLGGASGRLGGASGRLGGASGRLDRTSGLLDTAAHPDITASLIPIAVGYTLAHYLTLLLVEAPKGVLLLIHQPETAWTFTPAPAAIATAQITLILIGHVLGVIVAHDRALAAHPDRPPLAVLADELPLVLFMIACTWAGLFLLFVR